ncbi:MAG: DUF1631 domain-containing protein [Gammaproteobacteria bacterium]|nr:DUF1631 domain-containing protein [Gammaproteobacteria bacterium]
MSDQQDQNPNYAEVVENIRSALASFFSSHMTTLFEKADDFLFESVNSASNIAEQNRMFEFMNALRVDRKKLEQHFNTELSIYFKPLSQQKELPRKKHHKDNQQNSDELSLVATDEMDEMVTLSSISGKAAMNMQEEISHLEARLDELGLKTKDIFHFEALKPVRICDAFQDALTCTDYDRKNKLLLYKIFGDEVITPLKEIYDELNKLLIEQGILPKIEYRGKVNKNRAERRVESHDELSEDDVAGPVGSGSTGGRSGGTSGGTSAGGSGGGSAGGSGGGSGGGSTGSASQSQVQGDRGASPAYSASHVQQAIHDFLGGDPSQSDAGDGPSEGPGGGGFYSRQEVVGALSSLQSQVQIQPGGKLEFNAAAIKRAVLSTIGEQQGGVVNKAVHQISEKTIDFIKLIFDAIIEDKSITDAIKAILLSLQIPVIKAAMLDADFFVDDKHPARLLLDKLAEAGVGVSEHSDEVYIAINAIVQKLLKEFEEDITVFKNALDELTELVDDIYRQAQEREQQSYEEVQHAHARNIVLQEIRKITLGKELPQGVHTLVLKVWPSMMFNYFLKHGKANDEWIDMLMILSKIIDSVQLSGSMSELEELGFSFDDLVKAVRQKLEANYKKKGLIKTVIADLCSTYEQVAAQRKEHEQQQQQLEEQSEEKMENVVLATMLAAQSREDVTSETAETVAEVEAEIVDEVSEEVEQEVEESAEDIARRKLQKLPDTIKPGTWCIVYNGEDRPVRRLKLAIILVQDATLVFVDHMGNVVIEKDAEVFADELERDLSGVIMQHSVFDHALNSALGSISSTTKH